MRTAQILYGSTPSGRDSFIFEEMKRITDGGGKVLYIVPEQYAFSADKTVLYRMGEKYSHLTETINFKRMAMTVNEKISPKKHDYITEEIKNLILYKIYLKNAKEFKTLFKRGASPDSVMLFKDIMTELKTNLITAEDLGETIERLPKESLLCGKLSDLKLIMEEYGRYTEENYRDFDDGFLRLAKNISEHKLYKDYHIFIDNFIHLSKSEYLVLDALFKNAKSICVSLMCDNCENTSEGDLFFLTSSLAREIEKLAKDSEMSVKYTKCAQNDEKHLLEIFTDADCEKSENIVMTDAKTRTDEVRHVLYKIKELTKNGASYNDIAVFSGDITAYEDIIASLFYDGEIPYFDDRKTPVSENPVCRILLNAFSFYLSGFKTDEMLRYLKSLLFLFDVSEGVCLFETVVSSFRPDKESIKNPEKWETAMSVALKGNGYLISKKNLLDYVYKKFVLPVCESFSPLKKKNRAEMYTECFFSFIHSLRIEECLKKLSDTSADNEIVPNAVSAYNMMIKAVKNIERINSAEEMTPKEWFELLSQSAGVYKTGKLPNLIDCVTVSDTERGRTGMKKYVFILGLNDSVTPKTNETTGFLTDSDRRLIEETTGTALPTALWRNNSSLLSFYRTCTMAEDTLFVSKSRFTDEGAELTPSFMWNRFERKAPPTEMFDCEYVSIKEAAQIAVSQMAEDVSPIMKKVRETKDGLMDDIKLTKEENYFDTKKILPKRIMDSKYQKKLATSVSRLETYRKCGYSYFLKYLLRVNEPETASYDFAKTGTLVHNIIDRFSKKLAENGMDWSEVTEDFAISEAKKSAYHEISENFPKLNMFNPRTKYLAGKISKTASKAIMYIKEHFLSGSFTPLGYEIPVDENGVSPLAISLFDGSVVEIYGRIDRADGWFDKDSDRLYVRIIDYKSSKKSIDFSLVKEGIQLQLLTYLYAVVKNGGEYLDFAGEILPGAALYMAFDHSLTRFENTPAPEEIRKAAAEKFMLDGIILNDDGVISAMDKELRDNPNYKSEAVNISSDKKGGYSVKNLVLREQFHMLLSDCENLIKETGERILDGEFFIRPYRFGDVTACDYCIYKSICNFDNTVNSYRTLSKVTKDDYFEPKNCK